MMAQSVSSEWDDEARLNVPFGKADIVFTNPPFGGKGKIEDGHVLGQYELASWDAQRKKASMPARKLFQTKVRLQTASPHAPVAPLPTPAPLDTRKADVSALP